MLASTTPGLLKTYMERAMPELSKVVSARCIVGLSEMSRAEQSKALGGFKNGDFNVLVSTNVCSEGIDIPACGLVVCTSLPNSGTALVQLRGRIRCGKNCR